MAEQGPSAQGTSALLRQSAIRQAFSDGYKGIIIVLLMLLYFERTAAAPSSSEGARSTHCAACLRLLFWHFDGT